MRFATIQLITLFLVSALARCLAFNVIRSNGKQTYHSKLSLSGLVRQHHCFIHSVTNKKLFHPSPISQYRPPSHASTELCTNQIMSNNELWHAVSHLRTQSWFNRFFISCIFCVTSMSILPSSSLAVESSPISRGSLLFETNCAGCHRGGANFIKESKTLQKDALEKYFKLDPSSIQLFVETKMPHKLLRTY
jgi:hypothetical protein